jgi:hypothetical protein
MQLQLRWPLAPNLILNMGELSKMSKTVTISYFSYTLLQQLTNKNSLRKKLCQLLFVWLGI